MTLVASGQVTITSQPGDQLDVPLDSPATFDVTAKGNGPLTYQWRLNGVNIPNETSQTLFISKVRQVHGGTYSVAVTDGTGAVNSSDARLTLQIPGAPKRDFFQNAVPLDGNQGLLRSDNRKTTKEPGEPDHNGNRGGRSIWFKWFAPATGIVRFSTAGSGFDTLLGIYTGRTVTDLTPVPSATGGEDEGGF